jgi:phytoene dehydrogenase-like protein
MSMLGQTVGFPVPQGGAGVLTQALAERVRAGCGEIRCSAEVVGIDVVGRRAVAVRTADGERVVAGRAVLADVVAGKLYGGLVAADDLPARTMRAMCTFQLDPGTVKVDWALDGGVPWASPPSHAPGTFHVADSVEDMTEALGQVNARWIPARPFMLAGQMTTTDPTRSPAGTESMWAYTHVPQHATRDAGEGGIRGEWDASDCERFADRMQERIERLAPGFGSRVLSRRVLGPRELEARDANLVGGAINGGTSQLHQELVFRPVPGLGRAETPVRGLYLASASAHPGGGVHGAAGMNAARAALAHDRLRTAGGLLPRRDPERTPR